MQTFDAEPSREQLAVLLAPEEKAWLLRTEDTPERLVVRPSGFLFWWGLFWLLVPNTLFAWYVIRKAILQGLEWFDGLATFMAMLAAPVLLVVLRYLNHLEVSPGDFFVLDKVRRVLTLSRQGRQLTQGQIVSFIEVQRWQRMVDRVSGEVICWLGELTVMVRDEQGRTVRLPVVASQQTGAVSRVGKALADFFSVERRLLRLDWKTRRQWARERE
jgi:hypothetical protein